MDNRDIIRNRMLKDLDDKYNKLPGSFVWEIFQAEAIESESIRIMLADSMNQRFAETADLEHLKKIASEKGVDWKDKTYASGYVKLKGTVGAIAKKGELVSNNKVNYRLDEPVVIDENGEFLARVTCEVGGTIGNTTKNSIIYFPKSLSGINSVTNEEEFTNGYNAETRKELLDRYYSYVRTPGTSGNKYHYMQWAKEIQGVGEVKVKPTWKGGGTVKVIILTSDGEPATEELINKVKDNIEVKRPIGAIVTVVTVDKLELNVDCKIELHVNYELEKVKNSIKKEIEDYLKKESFADGKVYYAKIGNIIYETEGVKNIDYSTLKLNGAKNDIILLDDNTTTQIAKIKNLNIVE